ncbi:threonine synthase, partial [Enterococcus lactis]
MEKYTSTRDKDVEISSFDAIIKGFSDDGGLFVLPDLADHNINIDKVIDQSYQEIAFDVVKTLLPDFSDFQIANSIHEAYDDGFDDYEVTPIKDV